jgi:hypothetical protein
MTYVVTFGEVHHDGEVYHLGDPLPCPQGSLADVEAVGAVAWVDEPSTDIVLDTEAAEAVTSEPVSADIVLDIPAARPRAKKGGRR